MRIRHGSFLPSFSIPFLRYLNFIGKRAKNESTLISVDHNTLGFLGFLCLALGIDAKHSFEDKILPIEEAYEKWHDRIPLFGGFDVDYLCRSSQDEIKRRVAAMMERTKDRGGWAIGSGNSIPVYIPAQNYMAMVEAAIGYNPLD